MAFTTQKGLFRTAKQLEMPSKACSKVLSIVNCQDSRAWAGPEARANFLLDLVHRSNDDRGGGDTAHMSETSAPEPICNVEQLKNELEAKTNEICRLQCQLEQQGAKDSTIKSQQDLIQQMELQIADLSKKNQRLAEMKHNQDSGPECDELLRERDRLRQKLDRLSGLEDQLVFLKERARNCDKMERERDEMQRRFAEQSSDIERQRSELDRLTGLEDQLVFLKERARNCDKMERERDEMQRRFAEQGSDIERLCSVHESSLTELQLKNNQLNGWRESMLSQRISEELLVEQRLKETENQLGTAEKAISEYEHDIQIQIATIVVYEQNAQQQQSTIDSLAQRLSASQLSQNASEQRLRVLDELETEVNTLQSQLSAALTHQRNQQMTDLVAAVKLTLLYVQNKLTSRETMVDDQTELERLKVELLNLREPQRSSQILQQQALESEIERLQSVVNTTATRDQTILQLINQQSQSLHHGISVIRRQLTTVIVELRKYLTQAKRNHLQLQNNTRMSLADKQITIEGLQQHVERSSIQQSNREQDLEAQLIEFRQENETLREKINILNGQINEFGLLVEQIERERLLNTELQSELSEHVEHVEHALTQLQSGDNSRGSLTQITLTDAQHSVDDALRTYTDQLEAEGSKCQALEDRVACLLDEVRVLNEKLQRFVERLSQLELEEKSKKERNEVEAIGIDDVKSCEGDSSKVRNVQGRLTKPQSKDVLCWRKFCEKIIMQGIESFNLRELSKLHDLIYMAGLRYKEMNSIAKTEATTTGNYVKEERLFYERKGLEHQQKVHELQHQLHDIRNGLAAVCDVRCFCPRVKSSGYRCARSKSAK